MALRQAGVSLGVSKFLAGGSWARLGSTLPQAFATSGLDQSEREESSSPQGPGDVLRVVRDNASSRTTDQFSLSSKEQQQAPRVGGMSLPPRPLRRGVLPGMTLASHRPGSMFLAPSMQTRSYNAWSPAQRYFVEGEHVVQAEANRTFQFTGLDGGSFYPYVVATIISTAIATVFIVLPLVVAPSRVDLDKSSAYECGFDAFGEARQTFSVSFYLVSIMYLLFDIEIVYLFPYAMTHASVPMYWTMNLFLAILVGGFAYEWGMGALEWRE